MSPPTSTDILVIGGGPSGSYAASALAREGFNVTLLEKDHFPRYHIGESLLPSSRSFMRFIGAEQKVLNHGFTVKVGAAVKLNQHKREGYTDFVNPDPTKAAWNVVRSEFDEILLRHATSSGAAVHEGIAVTSIKFGRAGDEKRPVAATWKSDEGETGEIQFNWLVDGSGKNGIMSTKYMKNRKFNNTLKNIAFWAYWKGAGTYMPGTKRENAPWFEALVDESGWAWFIPLHNGTVSVGIVLNEELSRVKKSKFTGPDAAKEHYLTELQRAPGTLKLMGNATMSSEVKSAGDYSYSASAYAGPGYRVAGDAGAFIDPFFSSGVHLAFAGGLSAATTIAASIRGQVTEEEAITFHNEKVGTSYTRFLVVVLSIYRQINSQAAPVLADVDEDNFDRAFDFLRPIIQGTADTVNAGVTEATVQATMDFCEHALGPTTPEMASAVAERVDASLIAPDGAIKSTAEVAEIAGSDEEAKQVLLRVNARKAVEGIYDWEGNFQSEVLNGFSVQLETGKLGLRRVGATKAM
ncbi:putative halogenase [Mycena metata]|uniref:Halogenase n=1 Tax=Mycena metata TaxID=1033252 RepID=A0AAD7MRD4_9AGAR|nr:putative halogenase [Mycena metata]